MMEIQKRLCLLVIVLLSLSTGAQDMQFSQVYSNPVYLNPASAGSEMNTRVVLNYRNQWPGLPNGYTAHGFGLDHYLSGVNGGLGVTFSKDVAGLHRLSNTRFSMSYGQHICLSRRLTASMGLKASVGQKTFDDNHLLFADQIINETQESASTSLLNLSANYADISLGGLIYSETWFVGFSVHHLNQPNVSLMDGEEPLQMKASIHGGTNIILNNGRGRDPFRSLHLSFNYKAQGNWDQLDIGGFLVNEHLQAGLWYRGLPLKSYAPGYSNHEAMVFMVGWIGEDFWSIGYSYDLTLSELSGYSGGAHELAVKIEIPPKRKPPRKRIVPCAKF